MKDKNTCCENPEIIACDKRWYNWHSGNTVGCEFVDAECINCHRIFTDSEELE